MNRSYALIIILLIVLGGFFLYRQLGGSPELTFKVQSESFTLYGEPFKGSYNSSLVENIFLKARDLGDSLNCNLVVVNYGSDEDAEQINQFIGIVSKPGIEVPDSYSEKSFENVMVSTLIDAHNSVMPKPEDVRELASDFADKNGYKITNATIEVYRSERELEVFFLTQ